MRTSTHCLLALSIVALLTWGATPTFALDPVPNFYQEPGLSANRETHNQQIHEHIDPFTGKLQIHQVDLNIPGNGGLDINVQRSYSSVNEFLEEQSVVGVGWTMHYGRVLRPATVGICKTSEINATRQPVLELPDGSRNILYFSNVVGASYWISTSRWRADCYGAGLGLTVTSPEGVRYEMTTPGPTQGPPGAAQNSWYTTRIIDRNGNTLNFTYAFHGSVLGMTGITSSDGRSVTFSYAGDTLSSVSDGSRTWTYAYDAGPGTQFPFLKQVTGPVGNIWNYTYNMDVTLLKGRYSMKTLQYPTGGIYTYKYGRVSFSSLLPLTTVVSSKTGDGGTWQYIYTPASKSCTVSAGACSLARDGTLDKTTILAPDGTYDYYHVGANTVSTGMVWAIGLLIHKDIEDLQAETNSWACQTISDVINFRPATTLIFDSNACAPLLSQKSTDRYGQLYETKYSSYDSYGNARIVKETGPSGDGTTIARTTTMTYAIDPAKWFLRNVSSEITDTGKNTSRTFDANGNLKQEIRQAVPTSFTYTSEGDLNTKTDARGNVSTYTLYLRGIPQREQYEEGVAYDRSVSVQGNILSQTDATGAKVSYSYDGLNRLTSIAHPLGNAVAITWSKNQRTVTRGSYLETTSYDAFGRVNNVAHKDTASGETIVEANRYDAVGRKIFASYPGDGSSGTGFLYTVMGTPYAVLHAVDSALTAYSGGQENQDHDSYKVIKTNELNHSMVYSYRGYGSPDSLEVMHIDSVDVPATNIQLTRNGLGQLLSVAQGGKSRTYVYDSNNFLHQVTEPETGSTLYGRDAVGNMLTRQVGASGITRYAYDKRNRLSTVIYSDGTPTVTRTYYLDEKLKRLDNVGAQRDYVYDANKNLLQETLTTDGKTFPIKYAYDGNDALSTLTYGSLKVVSYTPNAFGRPTQAAPYITSVSYHPNGQMKTMDYANGIHTSVNLNQRLLPNTLSASLGGSAIINSSYDLDLNGNVKGVTDSALPYWNRGFGYDGVNRLIEVDLPAPSGVLVSAGSVTYDGRGNILNQSVNDGSMSYTYDATRDLLMAVDGSVSRSFSYDVYGNVKTNGVNSFSYNEAQNLICVDCALTRVTKYAYDGGGIRLSTTKPDGTKGYAVYGASGQLLWETSPDIGLKEYIYLLGHQVATRQVN